MTRTGKVECTLTRVTTVFLAIVALTVPGAIALPGLLAQRTGPAASTSPAAVVQFALEGNAAAIPVQFVGNLVFLPVRVNEGKASLFELDSSSERTAIDLARATALELPVQKTANGASGEPTAGVILDCVINFPGVDVRTAALNVNSKKDFAAEVGKVYEGTLGNDFFARFVIQLDYGRKTMEIFDPASFHYSGSGISLPLSFVGGLPVIRAKFSTVTRKDIEADFVVNTALDASVLIGERFSETHRLFSSHEKTVSALDTELNLTAPVAFERARDFRIRSFKTEGTIIEFGPVAGLSGDARLAGEIGGGMLRRFNVVFDYPHRQIILEPNANFQSDDQEDKSGISVIAEGPGLRTFKIVQVEPGTPAADAGIQQGDIIAGIDDDAAADLTLAEVRDLFRQVGHIYKVLIDRDGKTMQVSVQMRRLLSS